MKVVFLLYFREISEKWRAQKWCSNEPGDTSMRWILILGQLGFLKTLLGTKLYDNWVFDLLGFCGLLYGEAVKG